MKICNNCKKEKEISEFNKTKSSKDGLHYCCKECVSLKNGSLRRFVYNLKDPINNKLCNKCKEEKSKLEFSHHKNSKDGLNHYCRKCIQTTRVKTIKKSKYQKILPKDPVNNKFCSKCQEEKNKSEFGINNNSKDNLTQWCKECYSKNNKSKRLKTRSLCKSQNVRNEYYYINQNKIETRICYKCKEEKNKSEFYKNKSRSDGLMCWCKSCMSQSDKIFNKKYPEKVKEAERKSFLKRKISINKTRAEWAKKSRRSNPNFILREKLTGAINKQLNKRNTNKLGKSITKYLPYTIQELTIYIESLFEPWMNWGNHGKYSRDNWNDNDQTTWTWQLDHIIPQCELPYNSLEDPNFIKCWELSNLRPLSSKENLARRFNS